MGGCVCVCACVCAKYIEICKRQDLTCMNTFIHPKMGTHEKIATWREKCGRRARQIDFFSINSIGENWVTQIRNNKIANIRQASQHKM